MAKRFTDKSKWDDEWYISLDNDCRIVWEYLLDRCDHAGIFKKNQKMINFCCNVEWDQQKLEEVFVDRIIDYVSFYFIPKYLKFQYPKGLNSKKPAIVSVRNILKEKGLLFFVNGLYGNDYLMIKEPLANDCIIIKDKDKDKDKDKGGFSFFVNAWEKYPGNKREASTEFQELLKHPDWKVQLGLLLSAIQKQHDWRLTSGGEFRPSWKDFKTWINGRHWEDVLSDPEAGGKECIVCSAPYSEGHKFTTNGRTNKKEYKCKECRL
jgi:hypothetical protein